MMSKRFHHILRLAFASLSIIGALPLYAQDQEAAQAATPASVPAASNRFERNFIVEGNKLYRQGRFAEAETMYKKALEQNSLSPQARFNLAASYIRQSGSADPNADRNPLSEAQKLLSDLSHLRDDMSEDERHIAELADYNLGNIAFNNNDFRSAIENYKKALRINPDNDKARQNLRLAQLKLQEQQNQDQNQDQNQNQNQNQDKQDQDNQDKNQNQDQDKNQDQNNQDNKQDQQPQGQDNNKEKQNPEKQRSGMSDANAEQILKAMENEEAATRRRVEAERRKSEAAKRRRVTNPW